MAIESPANEQSMRKVGAVLTATGILLIFGGVIVGFLVAPIGFIAIALGLIDLVIARQFVEGRRGNVIIPGAEPELDPDAAAAEEASPATPTPNPYARED
jgi:hypothetical protein